MSEQNCAMSETAGRCYHCGELITDTLQAVYINRGIHGACEKDARNGTLL